MCLDIVNWRHSAQVEVSAKSTSASLVRGYAVVQATVNPVMKQSIVARNPQSLCRYKYRVGEWEEARPKSYGEYVMGFHAFTYLSDAYEYHEDLSKYLTSDCGRREIWLCDLAGILAFGRLDLWKMYGGILTVRVALWRRLVKRIS